MLPHAFVTPIGVHPNRNETKVSVETSEFTRTLFRSRLRPRLARSHRCSRIPTVTASTQLPISTTFDPLARSSITHLQNGSDVRGVSSDLDSSKPVTLTADVVRDIVAAFVRRVAKSRSESPSSLRVALGCDSRISGEELMNAAAEGAASEGASVTKFGLCTTPAMFMACVLEGHEYDCTCMLTASHLPPNRNGIKFFTNNGSANKKDVKAILSDAADAIEARNGPLSVDSSVRDLITTYDFLPVYADHLVGLIRAGCNHPEHYETPLKGFKIVVDAGNGAAGFFATHVLSDLGADVVGQYLEPDGMFPNHEPNPENKKAMSMTIDAVKRVQADLGVIFDTDVDRSGFVDQDGNGINRNRLIALMSYIVLRENSGSTIVTDSVTSNGLKRFIEHHGGNHFRYRKGYKNVIDKGIELNEKGINTELAIETSGHGAMRENYMLDDGAYLAVKIIIEMVRLRLAGDKRGIGGLLDGLDAPVEEEEFRLDFRDASDFEKDGTKIVEAFSKFAPTVEGWSLESENYEGYRVNVDEGDGKAGWLLLRRSLHDPLLPLNVESEVSGGVAKILKVLLDKFFPEFDSVDISKLEKYVQ